MLPGDKRIFECEKEAQANEYMRLKTALNGC